MREKNLVGKIIRQLNSVSHCKAIKTHGSIYMEGGTPDIVGCYNGCMFAIEAKVNGNTLTELQSHRLEEWKEAGAVVAMADETFSVNEFLYRTLRLKGVTYNGDRCFSQGAH